MSKTKLVANSSVSSPEEVSCSEECVLEEEGIEEVFTPSEEEKLVLSIPKTRKDSGKVEKKKRRRSTKDRKCSGPLILKWLEQNYEMVPGACLPRSVLYTHYQDFCKRNHMEPSSAASFGKIIRMKFPNLSTRRLGTRGQSKYHYYGLAIKETSVYFRSVYSKQGLTRFSGAALKRENGQFYNPSSRTGVLLPDFPKLSDLDFGKQFPTDKVETFLLMYRAHCQRILDSVVRTNFHEVQDFLVHFWQGMPQHMLPILASQAIVDLVVICDFIMYNCLCEILIPANLQQLPDHMVDEIVTFSHSLVEWLFTALQDLPSPLGIRKVQGAEMFGKALRRQTGLMQLAKGARNVLRGSESVSCILNDWRSIDFESAASQVVLSNQFSDQTIDLFKEFSAELEQLMVKQSSLEIYFEWLDSLIERKVCEPANKGVSTLQELSQDFLATWSNFYHVVEREVTLLKGKSFDFYRLVHLVLSEYIHHVVESLQSKLIETQYNNIISNFKGSDKSCATSTGDSQAVLLPPIFPPTPTSASSEQDFLYYFESKMAHEFSSEIGVYSSQYSSLQSPTFAATGMGDSSVYDSFFGCDIGDPVYAAQRQPGVPPASLNISGRRGSSQGGGEGSQAGPLTPLSSHSSSGSPLSHTSAQSPRESVSMTPDIAEGGLLGGRPISQVSMYNESPLSLGPAQQPPTVNTPSTVPPLFSGSYSVCSPTDSSCTSPLQHMPTLIPINSGSGGGAELGIATSLDLVASHESNIICPAVGHNSHSNPYPMETQYRMPSVSMVPQSSPPLNHPHHYTHEYQQQLHLGMSPTSYIQGSPNFIVDPRYSAMAPEMNSYSFELHHLNPSDLLAEPACKMEDTKPPMGSLAQSPTAII